MNWSTITGIFSKIGSAIKTSNVVTDLELRLGIAERAIMEMDAELFSAPKSTLSVKRLTPTAKLPTRGSVGAIGLDLYADCPEQTIGPNERKLVSTGIAIAVPCGYYARVAPRSGLALKSGINTLAGVVDEDYRGEVFVLLHNTDAFRPFVVEPGMRIAQLILECADQFEVKEVDDLPASDRGEDGFGSTGNA